LNTAYIYGLKEPDTQLIRYIGKSIRPQQRLRNHINDKSKCHRTNWIRSLKQRGLEPELIIIEEIHGEWPWQESEKFWIAFARKHGWPLVNSTDGGDGVVNLSGESKERMAKTWVGRKHKPESLIKIGLASKGRHHTEEHKQHMKEIMSNREFTEEWRKKLSLANRKFTSEQVIEIRKRLANGERVKDLAQEYGVHRTTITNIKKEHFYGDVN
jgi:hypothetical protein